MIDRKALEALVSAQAEAMAAPNGISLILHFQNGERYEVHDFVEFHDGYCLAAVYPQQTLEPEDLGGLIPADAAGNLIFDRLIIPYQMIAYVTITARQLGRTTEFGFNP